jgi:UDP-N-acetylmuramate dehydrogenase
MISQNIDLKAYNSFGIRVFANKFANFRDESELIALLADPEIRLNKKMILGGGSNLLLTKNFEGCILRNEIPGIEVVAKDDSSVWVKAGAGVAWHELVMYAVSNRYAGIENLALIPGTVGAAPIQNIGAYGVELKDVFETLEAIHIDRLEKKCFSAAECRFGYRDSIFKQEEKGHWVIVSVTLKLSLQPVYNIKYKALEIQIHQSGDKVLSLEKIARAVMDIRMSKLPDPKIIGNAGSFFKNPEISTIDYEQLKQTYPDLVAFQSGEKFKLAAAWLIEQCGWKGFRKGDAGCHEKQALVLVNYGHATGDQILQLSEEIIDSVENKFHVRLEREVNVI